MRLRKPFRFAPLLFSYSVPQSRSFIKSEILSGLEPEVVGLCGLDPLVPRPTNGEGWESMWRELIDE